MDWLLFIIPCLLLLVVIFRNLIVPERTVRNYYAEIERDGFRKSELRRSIPSAILGVCFLLAYPFVDYRFIWTALGLMAFAGPVFFIFHTTADQDVKEMFTNVNNDTISKAIRKRRLNAVWKILILAAWCLSWPLPST